MDFNVEIYRTEHECIEHWDLRRKFLLAHKEKFQIDRLICLAQVFINVEILGCRYPDETMQLIRNLAEGVADEYRERKKNKLQRTFVQASDVAETKAKGVRKKSHADLVKNDSQTCEPESKKSFTPIQFASSSETLSTSTPGPWVGGYQSFTKSSDSSKNVSKIENKNIKKHPSLKNIIKSQLSRVIILENTFNNSPSSVTIVRSLQLYGIPTEDLLRCSSLPNGNTCCQLFVNGKELVTTECSKRADARESAAEVLLDEMRDFCFTIQIKAQFVSDTTVDTQFSNLGKDGKSAEEVVPDSNIGNKLLRMMGWSGGGLGKNEQGIEKPVSVQECINRSGLGHTDVKQELRRLLHDFAKGQFENDLAFSADFSKDERAMIHQLAKTYNLKSKSHGTGNNRQLVISRKENPSQLLHRLIQSGGATEKYTVIKPRNHI